MGVPVAGLTTATVTVAVTAVPWVIVAGVELPFIFKVLVVALKLPTAVIERVACGNYARVLKDAFQG